MTALLSVPFEANRFAPFLSLRVQNSDQTGTVCGSDFKTYTWKSLSEARKEEPDITIVHNGTCKKVCQEDKPICATDNKTYRNICYLNLERLKHLDLFAVHSGVCRLKLSSFIKLPKKHLALSKKKRISLSYKDKKSRNYDAWLFHG